MAEKKSARAVALTVLLQIEKEQAYANLALQKELKARKLNKLDNAFVTRLVYGVEQNKSYLDHILSGFLQKPLSELPLPILLILRLGIYQLVCLDKIPAHAAINECVKLAKKYGHPGIIRLVNGVLRNVERKKGKIELPLWPKQAEDYLVLKESHPRFLVRRLLAELDPEEALAFCCSNNEPAPVAVRVNTLRISREDLVALWQEKGIPTQKSSWSKDGLLLAKSAAIKELPGYQEGFFTIQDISSQLAALALNPQEGSQVLDLCAAPGGKSTHMAQLMHNKGQIYAFDVYEHKIKLLEENARRLGIDVIKAQKNDARHLPKQFQGWADYCLVDLPCSGLGVLSRRADLRWHVQEEAIGQLAQLGRQILQAAAGYVKPGGILLMSTCTITLEENHLNLKWFLQQFPEFDLCSLNEQIPNAPEEGFWQIWPQREKKEHLDGFFMARLRKNE